MSRRLGGIIGCRDKTSSWHLNGFPDGIIVTLGQQYHVGEKPTVILLHGVETKMSRINMLLDINIPTLTNIHVYLHIPGIYVRLHI